MFTHRNGVTYKVTRRANGGLLVQQRRAAAPGQPAWSTVRPAPPWAADLMRAVERYERKNRRRIVYMNSW